MKLFFVIALLCASFVSFAQHDTRTVIGCGYTSEGSAFYHHFSVLVNADETEVSTYHFDWASQSWCYKVVITCNSLALNKEKVPDVAKVIQSQSCDLREGEYLYPILD
jgi:hypothetical protein